MIVKYMFGLSDTKTSSEMNNYNLRGIGLVYVHAHNLQNIKKPSEPLKTFKLV